mgnify:FL=1
MKKKKIIIVAIIALLVIIGIVVGMLLIFGKEKNYETSKLTDIYNDLIASNIYNFSITQNDENKTIMAKNGEQTAIDQYLGDTHSTTIVKDGNTYLVLHDRKEYYVYQNNNVEQSILTDGMKELMNKTFTIGEEEVNGKKYSYEEFDGSSIFMLSNNLPLNQEGVKTRLYFNKKSELVYIKTTYDDNEELLGVSISKDVDNSLFEIPADYAEN